MTTPTEDPMNLLAVLDRFAFWKLQTIHSEGKRRYECQIRSDEGDEYRKVYTATAATKHDAIRRAISKATTRNKDLPGVTENEATLAHAGYRLRLVHGGNEE